MSRKRDPVIGVINYFEEADLGAARQALTIVQQIIRRRSPKGPAAKPRPSRAKTVTVAEGSAAGDSLN